MLKRQRFFEPPLRCLLALGLWLASSPLQGQSLLGTNPTLPQIHASTLAWADYDGDGDADLLMLGEDSVGAPRTILLRNDGATVFTVVSTPFHEWPMAAAAWGDLDGDGDPDLLQAGMATDLAPSLNGRGAVALWENGGGAGFGAVPCRLPGVRAGALAWSDLDGDGDQDVVLAGENYDEGLKTYVARNDAGDLHALGAGLPGLRCGEVAIGDLHGSPLPDLVLMGQGAHGEALSRVFTNIGGLQFWEYADVLPSTVDGSAAIADMEGDGDGDLLALGQGRPYVLGLWRNDGGSISPTSLLGQPGVMRGMVRWADFDGDGLLDMAYGGDGYGGSAVVRAMRQLSGGTFNDVQPLVPLRALTRPVMAFGDWSGDGHPDLALSGRDASGYPVALLYKWNNFLNRFEP